MKHLLVGINAKYIHSNLAIRSIQQYAQNQHGISFSLAEYTINQRPEIILAELFRQRPDSIGFSCYIWNYTLICRLATELKKILPECILYFGGPEVSYNAAEVLASTAADYVICGEGERAVPLFIAALESHSDLREVPNLVFRSGNTVTVNPSSSLLPMDELPFVYQDLTDLEDKIIYYESSRGCPFQCQYCLSCIDQGVRMMSLQRVFADLDFFLKAAVRQVKLVDRTFNCDPNYAMAIWRYLKEHDNGVTNFHFEIAAELLDEEALSFLPTVRRGFFQFEIGVQSTNPETLRAIRRFTNLERLRKVTEKLRQKQNIHLHLDLIVGLPFENYTCFRKSFNDVFALHPDQLQVGFLKLLKGSGLYDNCETYGLVCSDAPPYEVLYTRELPYADLLHLKMMEEMVEVYYNTNRFQRLLQYMIPLFAAPFDFFEALADYFEGNQLHLRPHTNTGYYTILWEFFEQCGSGSKEYFRVCALFDLYSHEKVKKLPVWLEESTDSAFKHAVYDFYDSPENRMQYLPEYSDCDTKQLIRQAHILRLPFDPVTMEAEACCYLFNYRQCDLLGNAAYHKLSPTLLKGDLNGKP